MAMGRRVGPRVVFLPGTLGSVLVDQSLTPDQAREECRRNLGPDRDRRWRGRPWYPVRQAARDPVGRRRQPPLVLQPRAVAAAPDPGQRL